MFKAGLLIFFYLIINYGNLYCQKTFEYRIGNNQFDESIIDIDENSQGDIWIILRSVSIENSTDIIESAFYRISTGGDTTQYSFVKQDTVLFYTDVEIDNDDNMVISATGRALQGDTTKFKWFCKCSPNFNKIWEYSPAIEGDTMLSGNSVFKYIGNGRFIYASNCLRKNSYIPHLYFYEFDSNGDSLHYKLIESEYTSGVYSITYDNVSSGIELHTNFSTVGSPYSCSLLKLDSLNNSVSNSQYPLPLYKEPFFTLSSENNDYLSFGRYWLGSDEYYVCAIRFDSSLNLINKKVLTHGDKYASSPSRSGIDYYYNDLLYVAGTYNWQMTPYEPNWIYLASLNSNLNVLHEEYLGGDLYYDIKCVKATHDGGVVVGGRVCDQISQYQEYDGYVMKLDSSFFISLEENNHISRKTKFQVFPNPVKINFTVIGMPEGSIIQLYDNVGRLKQELIVSGNSSGVNLAGLPNGFYILKGIENNRIVSTAIIIKNE